MMVPLPWWQPRKGGGVATPPKKSWSSRVAHHREIEVIIVHCHGRRSTTGNDRDTAAPWAQTPSGNPHLHPMLGSTERVGEGCLRPPDQIRPLKGLHVVATALAVTPSPIELDCLAAKGWRGRERAGRERGRLGEPRHHPPWWPHELC
jgi:hypothetical protein